MNGSSTADDRAGARIRASDAEREAVAAELADHLEDGRLDLSEFDERMGQAMAARTRGDLDQLLTDLPPRMVAPPPPSVHRPGWPFPLVPILMFALSIMLAGAVAHASSGPPHGGHPVWALFWLAWLIPAGILVARRGRRRGHGQQGTG